MKATAPRTLTRLLAALAALFLTTAGLTAVTSAPAAAEGRVNISGQPSQTKESKLKVSGSGFQSVKNGFGGIYVLFGTVKGTWRPSQGGKTGQDYEYAYDDESKPAGYQLFVSFPGSSTQYAANGGLLKADGTWNGTIKVAGAKFKTFDRDHNEKDIDCMKVQCGIITIGAHGVVNPNNETFTPVTFKKDGTAAAASSGKSGSSGGTSSTKAASGNSASGSKNSSSGSSGGTSSTSSNAGTSDQPSTGDGAAAPSIDNQAASDVGNGISMMVLLFAVGIVAALCVIALSVGVGSYMAMKALLLGVNPEALERVRTRREQRGIAAAQKRKRKVAAYQAKQERRTRKAEQAEDARNARADLSYPAAEATTYAGPEQSAPAGGEVGPMRFFDLVDPRDEANRAAADYGTAAPNGSTAAGAGRAREESPTQVLSSVGYEQNHSEGSKH